MQDVTETIEIDENLPPEPEAPETPYHTLLEVWRAVLAPARDGEMRNEKVSPQWATKIVSTYQGLTYGDTPAVNALLYLIVDELGQILDDEIATGDDPLEWADAESDVQNNSQHYRNLLTSWQCHMLRRELEWDPRDADAAVMLAALSEVHNMFFGQTGLTAHLESIKFQFTEEDQADLRTALEETRNAFYDGGEDE